MYLDINDQQCCDISNLQTRIHPQNDGKDDAFELFFNAVNEQTLRKGLPALLSSLFFQEEAVNLLLVFE